MLEIKNCISTRNFLVAFPPKIDRIKVKEKSNSGPLVNCGIFVDKNLNVYKLYYGNEPKDYYDPYNYKSYIIKVFQFTSDNVLEEIKTIKIKDCYNLELLFDHPYIFCFGENECNSWYLGSVNIHNNSTKYIYFNGLVLFMKYPYRSNRYLFVHSDNNETMIELLEPSLQGESCSISGECLSFSFNFENRILYLVTFDNSKFLLYLFDLLDFKIIKKITLDIPPSTSDVYVRNDIDSIYLICSSSEGKTKIIELKKKSYTKVCEIEIPYKTNGNIVVYDKKLIMIVEFDTYSNCIIEFDMKSKNIKRIGTIDSDLHFMKIDENIIIGNRYATESSQLSIIDDWIITSSALVRIKLEPSTRIISHFFDDTNCSILSIRHNLTFYTVPLERYVILKCIDFNLIETVLKMFLNGYPTMIPDSCDILVDCFENIELIRSIYISKKDTFTKTG